MTESGSSSKRFGARYGTRTRRNVDEAESGEEGYERVSAGVWKDTDTGKKVAGGAYRLDTGAEETMKRAMKVSTEELEEAKEEIEDE